MGAGLGGQPRVSAPAVFPGLGGRQLKCLDPFQLFSVLCPCLEFICGGRFTHTCGIGSDFFGQGCVPPFDSLRTQLFDQDGIAQRIFFTGRGHARHCAHGAPFAGLKSHSDCKMDSVLQAGGRFGLDHPAMCRADPGPVYPFACAGAVKPERRAKASVLHLPEPEGHTMQATLKAPERVGTASRPRNRITTYHAQFQGPCLAPCSHSGGTHDSPRCATGAGSL